MNENQGLLKQYNEEEIKQLLNSDEKLVYIDNGSEEEETKNLFRLLHWEWQLYLRLPILILFPEKTAEWIFPI